MRSSILLGSLCAVLAVASPINKALDKKAYVYDITTEIVYVTVTENYVAPTAVEAPKVTTSRTHHHTHATSSSVAPVVSSTSVYVAPPAPETTSTTPAPVPTTTSVYVAPAPTTSTSEAAAVETVVKQAAAASGASAASPSNIYKATALQHSNAHRANHSASALTWDDTLASYALATAKKCVFAHDMTEGTAGYGQNLAAYGTTGDIASLNPASLVADAITNQWYYGEAAAVPYGQQNPAVVNVPEFLHFTALVWKASTTMGCATVQCPAGTIFKYHSLYTVCDYKTEGNVLGAFASNVVKPIGLAPITATIS